MESYLSGAQQQITFTTDEYRNEDHIDRAIRNLKELNKENQLIRQEMQKIKSNPKAFIKPIRDQMSVKINQLKQENDSLRSMIERAKIPAYCQMTKKKISTDYDENQSNRESLRGSFKMRNPLDEIQSNFDKNDARSTCLNYQQQPNVQQQSRNYVVGTCDQQQRDALTSQIRLMLQKAEVFEQELQKISKKEKDELKSNKRDQASERELAKIYEYKKKLIKLLNKLKNRQVAMKQLVQTYREMHEQTFQRLQDANAVLQKLRDAQITQDVDQKYAQVIELEERLNSINAQLEEMDESKWLQEIVKELTHAVRRMGMEIPKCDSNRELIDQLCGMLIECHISSRKDGQAKLSMLKQYHQQQKKANSKYIMNLKSKEQCLGRKLIDLQMEK